MILDCTQHDPDDRPDFTQIRDRMVCLEGGGGGGGQGRTVREMKEGKESERIRMGGRKGVGEEEEEE